MLGGFSGILPKFYPLTLSKTLEIPAFLSSSISLNPSNFPQMVFSAGTASALTSTNFFCKISSPVRPYNFPQFQNNPSKIKHKLYYRTRFSLIKPRRRRRNTLREKLIRVPSEDQVNPPIPLPLDITKELDENDNFSSTNSQLWDKLQSWADRHLEDSDLWGGAADPTSPNYQDPSVVKDLEEFNYASNSNEQFAVEGKNKSSSLIDYLQTISNPSAPFGFMVLCTLCVVGVAVKLFLGNGKVELKREEVEMLRRKKRLRMERKESEKGSVEILDNGLPMTPNIRPQLDRNELLKCIKQAEKSGESLVVSDSSRCDFDRKVREIREMAREVREMEQKGLAQNDESREENDSSPIVDVPMGHVAVDAREESDPKKSGSYEAGRKNCKDPADVILEGEASNVSFINKDTIIRNSDVHDTNTLGFSTGKPTTVENNAHGNNSNSLISQHALTNVQVVKDEVESGNLLGKKSSVTSAGTSNSVRNIPKLIMSVKDAKKYLAEKHGMSSDKLQSEQEVQLNRSEAGVTDCDHDDKPIKISQKINEIEAVDPAELSTTEIDADKNSVSLLKVAFTDDVSKTNFHEVCTRNVNSSMKIDENRVLGENNLNLPEGIPVRISEKPSGVSANGHASILNEKVTYKMVHPGESLNSARNSESTVYRTQNLNVKGRSIENQSQWNNDAHTFYTSDSKPKVACPETSYNSSSPAACSVGARQVRIDNGAYSSKQSEIPSNEGNFDSKAQVMAFQDGSESGNATANGPKPNKACKVMVESKKIDPLDRTLVADSFLEESLLKKVEFNDNASQLYPVDDEMSSAVQPSSLDAAFENDDKHDMEGLRSLGKSFQPTSAIPDRDTEKLEMDGHGRWIEENFQQFDPIINTIGSGFRENYMSAKEKAQQSIVSAELSELGLFVDDEELEWMKDEKLREIVFQVRDNELAGRDPFHLMDDADQHAFFKGLELKAEKVNEKLLGLHEWVHSRIENLDYGTDGISLNDPLEKIVPRWKGPAIDKELEFLDKFTEHRTENFAGNVGRSQRQTGNDLQRSVVTNDKTPNEASTSGKTLVECSDGSVRPGKKTGKEQWQHTKKWSRGFLEVYNAETDPEIKSVMKDMGKGLDRWITEKETQEVADLMGRIPKRKQRYIQKKMDKLKREVEMYGANAVVSKYREYSDDKGEDYLWWLDLQFVLCIELYTVEDGVNKVGFYSLEMAADLELNPRQYHVIAFEDPGDSKNFCYIVQGHMDTQGSGTAFVVAQPPKDAFREAKDNGFNVTVIKKGEMKLNIDQTLEEVEEEIVEIGSKIYHEKIMSERGVDIRTLMKGVISADKATRRSKGMLMKTGKS